MATTLTEKMRAVLRITSTDTDVTAEINDCIEACKIDLRLAGVCNIDETDALIVRAISLYCKAEYGYNDKSEKFRLSYNMLKQSLCLAGDYNTPDESEG